MWLAVANQDVPEASALLAELADAELRAAIPDEGVRRAATAIVDLDADQTTCPACLASVPHGATRCPGCLLRFA